MNGSPRSLTSRAPSPRSASEIRKRGAPGTLQRGRMKLDELQIGDARAGVIRERDAVAGGDAGIGRFAEDLTGAAGRQQRRVRANLLPLARCDRRTRRRRPAVARRAAR